MNCNSCGSPVPIGVTNCPNCGAIAPTETKPDYTSSTSPGGYYPPGFDAPLPYAADPTAPAVDIMRVWDYIWPNLISLIPCVGSIIWLVMMCIWAFGSEHGPNRKNFARANLIISLGVLVLYILLVVIMVAVGDSLVDYLYYYYS